MLYTFAAYATFYELYVALLKALIAFAIGASMIVSADRLLRVFKYLQITLRTTLTGQKPEARFACNPLPDPAQYSLVYPRVAVQLPMFNERAVCQAIIDSACELNWPRERFKVQVGLVWLCNKGGAWLRAASICRLPASLLLTLERGKLKVCVVGCRRRVCMRIHALIICMHYAGPGRQY